MTGMVVRCALGGYHNHETQCGGADLVRGLGLTSGIGDGPRGADLRDLGLGRGTAALTDAGSVESARRSTRAQDHGSPEERTSRDPGTAFPENPTGPDGNQRPGSVPGQARCDHERDFGGANGQRQTGTTRPPDPNPAPGTGAP